MKTDQNLQGPPSSLVVLGGVLTLISAFLLWFEIELGFDGSGDRSYKGTDLLEGLGYGLIAFGVALLVLGLMQYRRGGESRGRGFMITGAILGLLVALAGLVSVLQPATSLGQFGADEVAKDFGLGDDVDVSDEIRLADEEDQIRVKPETGPMVALAGGVLATLGAALGLSRSIRRPPTTPSEAPTAPEPDTM